MVNRLNARIVRFGIFAVILIVCGYILLRGLSYDTVVPLNRESAAQAGSQKQTQQLVVEAKPKKKGKVKATFVTLARNKDLHGLMDLIRSVEDRFNSKYHYDWVFLNDDDFNDEFKKYTLNLVLGQTHYGKIPTEQWSFPEWIDTAKAAAARKKMEEDKVIYGGSISYRHMCRYELGFFFRHPLMDEYEYYWRVEPDIKIFCDIDYDVFQFMKDNDKEYGFTITLPEYKATIPTLWETTQRFIKEFPQYLHKNNFMKWVSDDEGATYNGCHFWLNFEVGSLNFWRSEAYLKYFDYLDKAGGFFYERWGDAPVHSIAVSLFMDKSKIHFFGDVGYFHNPFHQCPFDEATRIKKKCVCNPEKDFTWKDYSCTEEFHTKQGLPKPQGWEAFAG